ncbi:MAG TPA: class I SAM-dependent methyltransferase [Steroidobacter sp.]|uniref:class I SAM-dependent methyltransferase n=1 Tax=Steroidobacter sp. TaxID=1978227 RepID=UPI002ED8ACAE
MTVNCSLSTLEAYDRWAASYPPEAHNPLMRIEQRAMLAHWPDVTDCCALDLACGTGRYSSLLMRSGAREVIAADFSTAMLRQVSAGTPVRANMVQLPFAASAFDVVVCGLALGHAPDLHRWVGEVARVLDDGGVLLYSDFHPEAARAGLTRSFKDEHNRSVVLPHCDYDVSEQREAIEAANLTLEVVQELRAGMDCQESFPGSDTFYRQWHGLPLVLIVRARKCAPCQRKA